MGGQTSPSRSMYMNVHGGIYVTLPWEQHAVMTALLGHGAL